MIIKFQSNVNRSNSHPHISKMLLYKASKIGGLGLPDFWSYDLAARWSQIAQWHIHNPKIPWVIFEKNSILPYSITWLLWGNKVSNHILEKQNQLVAHSYQLWKLHNKKFIMTSPTPPHNSFIGDPKFLTHHQDCINNLLKCTRSLMIRETEIKLFTRWYYTPAKHHSIFPSVPHTCLRDSIGSFFGNVKAYLNYGDNLKTFLPEFQTKTLKLPSSIVYYSPH